MKVKTKICKNILIRHDLVWTVPVVVDQPHPWQRAANILNSYQAVNTGNLTILLLLQSYHGGGHVIHHREDSRGSLALYELTDGEVVEILDIFPLYSLLFVLLLLSFQCKLDEDLL